MLRSVTFLLFSGLLAVVLSGCLKEECEATRTYQLWEPQYALAEEFRFPIAVEPARQACATGQIYYYQDFLFIAEPGEGIHLIDNTNPSAPLPTGFLPIKGAMDMAIRGGVLYANNYFDLVSFDLSNPREPRFLGRVEEAFPLLGAYNQGVGYLVGWEETQETLTVPCSDQNFGNSWFWLENRNLAAIDIANFDNSSESSNGNSAPAGIGGSLARFTIAQDHLYVIDEWNLRVFSLADPALPKAEATVGVGWGIETIFPYGEYLFIGSQTGMFIFDNRNPLAPEQMSVFEHARACDPVYVSGNRAYVTLRDGTTCQNFINQLDVVDISDLRNPRLVRTHPMHRPIGLSKAGDALFICEDDQGFKIFDASNDQLIGQRLLAHVRGFQARDIITLPSRQLAMVIGDGGLRQYRFSNLNEPELLSTLPVCD